MPNLLQYRCDNDRCLRHQMGQVFLFGSEQGEAVCPTCGWMLSAVYA